MKNKILIISLGALCALLVFETGYLVGIGEQRIRYVYHPAPRFEYFTPPPARDLVLNMQPIQQKSRSFFVAAMTSRETAEATIITINLPGLDKGDIKIDVKGKYLTVQAGQKKEVNIGNNNYYSEELSAANFVQRITLPENVRPERIRAEFNKDNLTITIPKDKRSKKVSESVINIPIK